MANRLKVALSSCLQLIAAATIAMVAVPAAAQELPRVVTEKGRHALFVDGKPYLVLGAQANNSSNYPAVLPQVWPTIRALHANTLEIPVAWEQVEPVEGQFDFSWLDALIPQARENNVRLVLLWFGTWKNTSGSYVPEWVKADGKRFPRMRTRDGKTHYVHTPHARATLEADKRAFVAMMRHLREIDMDVVVMHDVAAGPDGGREALAGGRIYLAEESFDLRIATPVARDRDRTTAGEAEA